MQQRGLPRIIVIAGGLLVVIQAFIHGFLGYKSVTSDLGQTPERIANLLFWAWFAVGTALAAFGLLAIYVSSWLARGKRWALVIVVGIGVTTLIILISPVFFGIGYPVIGIIGGLLLLTPLFLAGRFSERSYSRSADI